MQERQNNTTTTTTTEQCGCEGPWKVNQSYFVLVCILVVMVLVLGLFANVEKTKELLRSVWMQRFSWKWRQCKRRCKLALRTCFGAPTVEVNIAGDESLRNGNRKLSKSRSKFRLDVAWLIKWEELELMEEIGRGSFGSVYKGQWLNTIVAIKIPSTDIKKDMERKFEGEIYLMSKMKHPNVVIFMGACLEKPNVCLVLEYLELGNLRDFLHDMRNKHSLGMVLKFAADVACGMKYLHSVMGILQRDLKTSNLLLSNSFVVKIGDFGLSRYQVANETLTPCGTPYWTAPEVLSRGKYDEKADVFSFAIILWELMTRESPYQGLGPMEVAMKVAREGLRPRIPPFCLPEYADLMGRCWDQDPKRRPSFCEILEKLQQLCARHPFKHNDERSEWKVGNALYGLGRSALAQSFRGLQQ